MKGWFRMYTEVLNDPKVQRLPGDTFKTWVNLLCLARLHDGHIPPIEDAAFALRLSDDEAAQAIEALMQAGLIEETETGLQPHNWGGRQYKSDVSTERVKRFRKRKVKQDQSASGNAPETVGETAPETESDTETEQNRSPNGDSDSCALAVELWNSFAVEQHLPKVQVLSEKRRKDLKARLKECGGIEGWKVALKRVAESPYLLGEVKDWRCDFDFLLQKSRFIKLMEGGYAPSSRQRAARSDAHGSQAAAFSRVASGIDSAVSDESGPGNTAAGHPASGPQPPSGPVDLASAGGAEVDPGQSDDAARPLGSASGERAAARGHGSGLAGEPQGPSSACDHGSVLDLVAGAGVQANAGGDQEADVRGDTGAAGRTDASGETAGTTARAKLTQHVDDLEFLEQEHG